MPRRKKVQTETISEGGPKKRPTKQPVRTSPIKPADDKPSRWDKVIGVDGKIVRVREDEKDKFVEMGNMVMKGKARRMYVGVDGNYMFHYYEIFKDK